MPPALPDLAAQAKTVPIDCNRACLEGSARELERVVVIPTQGAGHYVQDTREEAAMRGGAKRRRIER